MTRRLRLPAAARALLVAGAVASCWLAAGRAQAADDTIIARRGEDTLSVAQARALIASTDPQTRAQIAANPAMLTGVLRDYLMTRGLLEQANSEKWAERPEVLAALDRLRERLIVESFLAAKSQPPASYPADAEIAAFYDANKQKFLVPRSYQLVQIFLPADGDDAQKAARAALGQLRPRLLRQQGDFAHAAAGVKGAAFQDLGWLPEDRIVEPVRSIARGLEEGGISDPVCTPSGCHLLKLVATRPAGPAPLAQIRDQIVQLMRQQRQRELAAAYQQGLLSKTPVQVNEIELDKLTAPAK